jgi:sialate O-acetylesterase
MTVKGSSGNTITFKNVQVGEVWVCSGQSNMEMGIGVCNNAQEEIAAANYPNIRLFKVVKAKAAAPADDVKGNWAVCTPGSVAADGWGGFSAAAYYFGRMLHKELNVPVGLIDTSWGGTPAEFWTSHKTLESTPVLKDSAKGESSCLYNGMLAPLMPYAIRGAIWYQGEANLGGAYRYRTLLPAMIANWRQDWGQGDFPFGIVQLAPWRYNGADPACWAELCEAQRMTLDKSPNTGLAVTVDIGDIKDIHPKNKQDVGRRLALWAMAKVYGKNIVYSGPIYKSMKVEGNKIRLDFDHVGGGLIASDGKPLTEFTIAGEDKKFVPAVAEIDGQTVVVHSDAVANPVSVRFGWQDCAQPNFANKEGLPTSPFRTDTWKGVTE